MKVYDIFSYVPENELSLESIEERFRLYRYAGKADSDEYDFISDEVPRTPDPDVINCVYELRVDVQLDQEELLLSSSNLQ